MIIAQGYPLAAEVRVEPGDPRGSYAYIPIVAWCVNENGKPQYAILADGGKRYMADEGGQGAKVHAWRAVIPV